MIFVPMTSMAGTQDFFSSLSPVTAQIIWKPNDVDDGCRGRSILLCPDVLLLLQPKHHKAYHIPLAHVWAGLKKIPEDRCISLPGL